MANKRRLPVVQPEGEAAEPPRPAWHWVGFGAVAIFVAWLPLAYIAETVSRALVTARIGHGETDLDSLTRAERLRVLAMLAVPQLLALVLAGTGGGFLVTRFGQGTRRRQAALAGLAVGLVALALTYQHAGLSLLVVPCVAAGAAALGGHLGVRKL